MEHAKKSGASLSLPSKNLQTQAKKWQTHCAAESKMAGFHNVKGKKPANPAKNSKKRQLFGNMKTAKNDKNGNLPFLPPPGVRCGGCLDTVWVCLKRMLRRDFVVSLGGMIFVPSFVSFTGIFWKDFEISFRG